MTCQHAETTTVAWLYQEGPEDHVHHVATCEVCQEVARLHSEVMSTIGPALADVGQTPSRRSAMALTAPNVVRAPPVAARAANRPWGLVVAAMVAVAAVILVAATPWLMAQAPSNNVAHQRPDPPELTPQTPQVVQSPVAPDQPAIPPLEPGSPDKAVEHLLVAADDIPDGLDEMDQGLDDIFDELDAFEQDMLTL